MRLKISSNGFILRFICRTINRWSDWPVTVFFRPSAEFRGGRKVHPLFARIWALQTSTVATMNMTAAITNEEGGNIRRNDELHPNERGRNTLEGEIVIESAHYF
jgi:hypothetical protein